MTWDFIVVGAGSAGAVIATRLSESGKHKVLLLEAGGTDWRFYVQMPLGYGKTFYDKSVNWMYKAEPDPGLNGQSDFYPRGKLRGGSNATVLLDMPGRTVDARADIPPPLCNFSQSC